MSDVQQRNEYTKKNDRLCIFKQCNQQTRLVETELEYTSHQHYSINYDHLIQQEDLKTFFQQHYAKQSILEQQKLQQYVERLNQIVEQVVRLIEQIKQQHHNEMLDYENKIKIALDQLNNPKQLHEYIEELLQYNIQYDKEQNRVLLQQIIKECQGLKKFSFFQGIEYHDYYEKEIKLKGQISSQISNNQKYLVNAYQKEIQITNLNKKQTVKITNKSIVFCSRLSIDSKFLFCGNNSGQIFCFQVNNSKLISKIKIDNQSMNIIKPLDSNKLLICSPAHQSFIILDLYKKKQLSKIQYANYIQIHSIDYDLLKEVIITGSNDKSIKFFAFDSQILINKKEAHSTPVYQIQYIKKKNLLSNGGSDLRIWEIDYDLKQLTLIRQLQDNHFIYSCQSILQDQMIIKIHQKYLEILDKDLNLIESIWHYINPLKVIQQSNQLNNLNYIMIEGQRSLKVMKMKKFDL